MDFVLIYILSVLFVASVIRSAFGFGESLVAVPLLALVIPLHIAVPLSVLASVVIALVITAKDWRDIHFESAKNLVFATLFGLPIGFFALKNFDNKLLNIFLGILLIAFSLTSLSGVKLGVLRGRRPVVTSLFGFVAGILGGAYGMNGPPLVIYGSLRQWSPRNFRATLQAYFLPSSFLGIIGFWFFGVLTSEVWRYFFFSLLAIFPAIFIGKILNHALSERLFRMILFIALILIGCMLIFSDINGHPPL